MLPSAPEIMAANDGSTLRIPETLLRKATTTFELGCNGQNLITPCNDWTVLKNWLDEQTLAAEESSTVATTGQVKLILINFDLDLWTAGGDPESCLLGLLDTLQIPQSVYTREDIVRSILFAPSFDTFDQPGINAYQAVAQCIVCDTSGIAWRYYPQSLTSIGVAWSTDKEAGRRLHLFSKKLFCSTNYYIIPC